MVGVWFFTLFALICSCMYYSSQCVQKAVEIWHASARGRLEKKGFDFVCALLVYGISYPLFFAFSKFQRF